MLEFTKEALEVNKLAQFTDVIEICEQYNDLNTELNEGIGGLMTSDGIDQIREGYTNVDGVLQDIRNKLEYADTDLVLDAQLKRIETYKGTVFEDMLKDTVSPHFKDIEEKQVLIETSEGGTKPDIILRDAVEDLKIGNTEVKKGEDLFCEVKCGKKEYIENQMPHIEKQVLGHQEGNSVVIVTKDYLEIEPGKCAAFEARLEQLNSSICVVDVAAEEVENVILENIMQR